MATATGDFLAFQQLEGQHEQQALVRVIQVAAEDRLDVVQPVEQGVFVEIEPLGDLTINSVAQDWCTKILKMDA